MTEDREYLQKILPLLKKEMPIKWRVQSFSKFKPEATCVAYIDARNVQDRLDEVCEYGWVREHREIKGHVYAGVGVCMPSGAIQWRWDCGVESNTEAEKGESSDSFKRAAVNWGPGRFLYDLKIQRLPANEKKVDKPQKNYLHVVNNNGKRVWDLTDHINSMKPRKKEETITTDIIKTFLDSCKTVKSVEDYYRKNRKFIDSLFEDENIEVTSWFADKKKDLEEMK